MSNWFDAFGCGNSFSGNWDFIPQKSRREQIDEARKLIEENLDDAIRQENLLQKALQAGDPDAARAAQKELDESLRGASVWEDRLQSLLREPLRRQA